MDRSSLSRKRIGDWSPILGGRANGRNANDPGRRKAHESHHVYAPSFIVPLVAPTMVVIAVAVAVAVAGFGLIGRRSRGRGSRDSDRWGCCGHSCEVGENFDGGGADLVELGVGDLSGRVRGREVSVERGECSLSTWILAMLRGLGERLNVLLKLCLGGGIDAAGANAVARACTKHQSRTRSGGRAESASHRRVLWSSRRSTPNWPCTLG